MRFSTSQQELHQGLAVVAHAIAGRPTLPIGAYIKAETQTESRRVQLSARSEDIGIHCWISANEVEEDQITLLPAQLFSDFVENLPRFPVTVISPSPTDAMSCHIRCQRINANMKNAAHDPLEYPYIPCSSDAGVSLLKMDAELLKQTIGQVAFAAARSEMSRPAFTGINIEIGNGQALFAAADSFCLAVRSLLIPDEQMRQTLLLPVKAMEELAKLLPYEGSVEVLLTENHSQAVFHTARVDVAIRLLEATFPEGYRGVIPSTWTTRAVLQTQELASLVRLMAPFARQGRKDIGVKLTGEAYENQPPDWEPGTVTLSVMAQDVGENQNVLTAQVQGPDQEMSLQVNYLSEILSKITAREVAFEMTTPQRPAVIKPIGGDDSTYVMMPVHFGATPAPSRAEQVPVGAAR